MRLVANTYVVPARDWTPARARQCVKGVLIKWAKSIGGEVEVGQVNADPPGFMAHMSQPDGDVTLTFRFPEYDDRPSARPMADTGASVSCEGTLEVPEHVMGKLEGMLGRVAPLHMPEVIPAPRKSEKDSLGRPMLAPFPVKVVRNGNGKAIGLGDVFDGASGKSVRGTGKNARKGLRIKHARGAKVRPPMGASPSGAVGAPVPNGYPERPERIEDVGAAVRGHMQAMREAIAVRSLNKKAQA